MSVKIDKVALKAILEEQKQKVLDSLQYSREAARLVKLDQSSVGRLSRMDAMQQQARRIDATLQRLDSEAYGYCVECGEAIDWQLLKSNPSLVFCRDCRQRLKE